MLDIAHNIIMPVRNTAGKFFFQAPQLYSEVPKLIPNGCIYYSQCISYYSHVLGVKG